MSVSDLCNMVCRDLPEGYEITIRLERHAGSVEMDCPDPLEWCDDHYSGGIESAVVDAVAFANQHNGKAAD